MRRRAFWAYVRRNHLALFPLLPERSRYNRRRRHLSEVPNRIRGRIMARLWRVLAAEGRDLCVVDSLPVPVVGYPHAAGAHRWWGEADFGRVPSKKQRIYGFKLHRRISHSGLLLDFALAPANHSDGTLTAQLLEGKAGLVVLGDKGYLNAPLQAQVAAPHDLTLLPPKRKNQLAQLPEALTQAINHFRQRIETVNSQLVGQFRLQQNHAKSVFGLAARVQAKLAAHTLGLYLNYLLGRPFRALADLALISHNGYIVISRSTLPKSRCSSGRAAGLY